jgi:hypothetical protein
MDSSKQRLLRSTDKRTYRANFMPVLSYQVTGYLNVSLIHLHPQNYVTVTSHGTEVIVTTLTTRRWKNNYKAMCY